MGVGVFESDFDKTGGTFIIDQSYFDEDAYMENLRSLAEDLKIKILPFQENGLFSDERGHLIYQSEREALESEIELKGGIYQSFNQWSQQSSIDEWNDIKATICSALSGSPVDDNDYMDADKNFSLVCERGLFQVGIRSWETDYIIGVAPAAGLYNTFQDDLEIFTEYGVEPEEFRERVGDISERILFIARAALFKNAIQARYRTSGYTTGRYNDLDQIKNISSEINQKKEELTELMDQIFKPEAKKLKI